MIKNALVLFITCAVVFVLFLPSYIKMQEMNERNNAYQRQIKELTAESIKLTEERRRLKEDPEYLERVARKKFGIIKEGETIYKILPDGVAATKKNVETNADAKPKAKLKEKPKAAASKPKSTVSKAKTAAGTTKRSIAKKTTTTKTKVSSVKSKSSSTTSTIRKKTDVKKP